MTVSARAPRLCPDADCGLPLGGRTADKHRGCQTTTSTVAPQVLPKPQLTESFRAPGIAALLAAFAASSSWTALQVAPALAIPEPTTFGWSAAALAALGPVVHGVRLSRWRDRQEDTRVMARLVVLTGPGTVLARVHERDEHAPIDLTVTPGPKFDAGSVRHLADAYAFAIGVDAHQVTASATRGSYRLTRVLDAPGPGAQVRQLHAVPDASDDASDAPADLSAVEVRYQEALAAAVDDQGVTTTVLEWKGSRPTSILLRYPPRVAPKAQAVRADVITTLHALATPDGDWFARWQPDQDRYLLEDVPDPLARLVPLPVAEHSPDLYEGVTIGELEDGSPWRIPLMGGFHTLVGGATGAGKALAIDTPIPTPDGWTTMGAIRPGDVIFGADGSPTRVSWVSGHMQDHECFEVEFSDGEVIVADAEHQWVTSTKRSRQQSIRTPDPAKRHETAQTVFTTQEIAASIEDCHAVALCAPLEYPVEEAALLHPYALGAWLGDGTSTGNSLASNDPEMIRHLADAGVEAVFRSRYRHTLHLHDAPDRSRSRCQTPECVNRALPERAVCGAHLLAADRREGVKCLRCGAACRGTYCGACKQEGSFVGRLRMLGVYANKHVPEPYLRGSVQQRMDLLAGLLDTDGTCTGAGKVEFASSNERLANDVLELAVGLGFRATLRRKKATLSGKDYGWTWTVAFTADRQVFRLSRKADKLAVGTCRANVRYIKAVRPVASVTVQCLAVENADHLFVAGRSCVVTHNSSPLWGIIRGLEHLIHDGRVRLWIADPKGGIEFDRAEGFAYRFAVDQDDIVAMFAEASQVMSRKAEAQRGKGRKIEAPTRETPLDLVVIDEIAAVVGQAAMPETARECNPHLVKMLTQGRAPLFTVVGAVQDPRKENLKLRGLFTLAVALRLSEAGETNLMLGMGARAKGAVADLIPETLPGVGFMVRDAKAGATRGRAAFVDDREIEALAARLAPAPALPAPRPVPGGEQLAMTALDMLPEPTRGTVGILADLVDGRRFIFDGETMPATCVGTPETDGDDLVVTYVYDDKPTQQREVQDTRDAQVLLLT